MSCDKDIDKVPKGVMNSGRGNWDAFPIKDHAPELLGKFGMTNYGSLGKKLKKLESGDLPLLNKKNQKISSPSERAWMISPTYYDNFHKKVIIPPDKYKVQNSAAGLDHFLQSRSPTDFSIV